MSSGRESDGISDHSQQSRDLNLHGSAGSGSHELRSPTTERREHCWVCAEWQFYEKNPFTGIVRVPLRLMHELDWTMRAWIRRQDDDQCNGGLERAWMNALARLFPRTPLAGIRAQDPSLLPLCLLQGFSKLQDLLVLRPNGIFAEVRYETSRYRCEDPLSVLAAASQCRFREGCASEGMLCKDPPIPLRVLDFLESSNDLLNLARVCKATHQAGHVLLQREFPGGLGQLTQADLHHVVARRKRDMLEGAMRRPIRRRAAPTSSRARKASRAEACSAAGSEEPRPALREYSRRYSSTAENDIVDCILLTLLEANKRLEPGYAKVYRDLSYSALAYMLGDEMRYGLTLNWEAVKRAVAMLEDREPRCRIFADMVHEDAVERIYSWRNSRGSNAEGLVRILQAAKREGHGVIVLTNMPHDQVACSCKQGDTGDC